MLKALWEYSTTNILSNKDTKETPQSNRNIQQSNKSL
jgi:hypothetical protein